ncbi:flavin reductase [Peribacillus asahii]|uniref:flavin reductase n=1 Tax=Peribacillus asahii TaxID=228899 RepID=UPI0037FB7B61
MEFKTEELNVHELFKLFSGSIVPRPIAWVYTLSKDGTNNIAPFSWFTVASENPTILCISIENREE